MKVPSSTHFSGRTAAVLVAAVCMGTAGFAQQETPPQSPPASASPAAEQPPSRSSNEAPVAPLPPRDFMPRMMRLIQHKQYALAQARLTPVVDQHPKWVRAQFYLGLTYHKQQRYAEAHERFDRVEALDPQHEPVLMFHGWCLYNLGRLQAARSRFNKYLAANPDYADAHFALGLIDFDEGLLQDAAQRYGRAIALGQADGDVIMESKSRARLGDVLMQQSRHEQARAEFERSVKLNPDNYQVYFKLSRVLRRLGDQAGAAEAWRKHVEVRDRIRPRQPRGERHPGE